MLPIYNAFTIFELIILIDFNLKMLKVGFVLCYLIEHGVLGHFNEWYFAVYDTIISTYFKIYMW